MDKIHNYKYGEISKGFLTEKKVSPLYCNQHLKYNISNSFSYKQCIYTSDSSEERKLPLHRSPGYLQYLPFNLKVLLKI